MKKQIIAFLLTAILIFPLFAQELTTPTTLYGCFEYFDKVFTEKEKEALKKLDNPSSIYTSVSYGIPNTFINQTTAYKNGKLKFIWKNRELYSNIVPDGYPGIHFEDYPGMIYRSYYYLLKYGDCRWDFILKAYAPTTFAWEYEDTGILRTVYPDNITNDDLKASHVWNFNYLSEDVWDTILFFKNDLNETYIYSFAYSWRKIPEKDFDDFIDGHSEIPFQNYFDELFKDSAFIGGL